MHKDKLLRILALVAAVMIFVVLLLVVFWPAGSPGEGLQDPTAPQKSGVFVICLDPGHGGTDVGTQSEDKQRNEKDDNLRLALAVRDYLLDAQADIEVLMTREDDSALTLMERCDFANDAQADIFVSLHRNGGGGQGVEVWIGSQGDSAEKALGNAMLKAIKSVGVNRDRGLRQGTAGSADKDYVVIRETQMPACIVELGFMDDQSDNDLFDQNMDAYAAALAEAILGMAP